MARIFLDWNSFHGPGMFKLLSCTVVAFFYTKPSLSQKLCLCEPTFGLAQKRLFLTLLHSEWPKLYGVLAVLSEIGLVCMATLPWETILLLK